MHSSNGLINSFPKNYHANKDRSRKAYTETRIDTNHINAIHKGERNAEHTPTLDEYLCSISLAGLMPEFQGVN